MISIDYQKAITLITKAVLGKKHFIDFRAAASEQLCLEYCHLLLFNPSQILIRIKKYEHTLTPATTPNQTSQVSLICNIQIMSKKNVTFKQQIENNSQALSSLPQILRLKNLTNQPENQELTTLRERIEELESKVSQLQSRMRTKNKRIRRKSCEVEKKHKCQHCKKLYGSLVSLNLHLRIKHRRERVERQGQNQHQEENQNNQQMENREFK